MIRQRLVLPGALGDHFAVGEALATGVKRSVRDHPGLLRPFHGARAVAKPPPEPGPYDPWTDPRKEAALERMASLWPVLPSRAVFVGPSAALLWDIPLPSNVLDDVYVAMPYPATPVRRAGVVGVRLKPQLGIMEMRKNYRTLSAATTWTSLGRFLELDDLVAAADSLIYSPRDIEDTFRTPEPPREAHATKADLVRALDMGRRPGSKLLRDALELTEERCVSRPETHTRLVLGRAGLPKPLLNTDVRHRGKLLGRPDIQYPDHLVDLEYQSAYHRTAKQYEEDIDRRRRFEEAGWIVIEVTAKLLYANPDEVGQARGARIESSRGAGPRAGRIDVARGKNSITQAPGRLLALATRPSGIQGADGWHWGRRCQELRVPRDPAGQGDAGRPELPGWTRC